MKVTQPVHEFIRKKVHEKVAPVTLEEDYNVLEAASVKFATDLNDELIALADKRFAEFLSVHPEAANAAMYNPIRDSYSKLSLTLNSTVIYTELEELRKLRLDYIDDLVQRVCIDATSCKDTEQLLALIDKIVGV